MSDCLILTQSSQREPVPVYFEAGPSLGVELDDEKFEKSRVR
jgi:hypothetical protein